MLHFAVKIELRSTASGGTDATIYAATKPITLDDSGAVAVPATLVLQQQFVAEFGRVDDRLQTPQRLGALLNNQNGTYSDFLPNGSDPQYWDLSEVTIYDISRANDGDTLASLSVEFAGFISPSTLIYPASLEVIEFDVLDRRINNNVAIASTTFGDNPNFGAGVNDDVQGTIAPHILGDWTDGTQTIPAFLIDDTGGAVYAVSNHEIGTLGSVTRNGSPVTPTATDLANGTFTIAGPADASDVVECQCIGYPTTFTDGNPVRMIEGVLTLFGGVAAANIFNPVDDAEITTTGSFEYAYNQVGGATPDYKMRAYINSSSDKALDVAARMAFESNFAITVDSTTDQYNIFWEIPSAPESSTLIREGQIDARAPVGFESDPDQTYANLARITYAINPSAGSEATRSYDSADVLGPTDPIEVARATFGQDIIYTDDFLYVYDDTGLQLSVNRRLFWRALMPQEVTITIDNNATQQAPWTLNLNQDFNTDYAPLGSESYRINRIARDPQTGQVSLRGRSLVDLVVTGRWDDGTGTYDSRWTDNNGDTPVGTPGRWI